MKYLPLVLMLVLTSFAQKLPERMPVHKLVWSEYKQAPPKDSTWSSMTGYEWSMDITTNSEGEVSAEVHCYFLPYLSWTKVNDTATLLHEQGHLNLANIYCLQLNKALKAVAGCKNCEETLNVMYQQAWDNMRGAQADYDIQTDHSRNKKVQFAWDQLISYQLKQVQ